MTSVPSTDSSTAVAVIEAGRPMIPAPRLGRPCRIGSTRPGRPCHGQVGAVLRRDADRRRRRRAVRRRGSCAPAPRRSAAGGAGNRPARARAGCACRSPGSRSARSNRASRRSRYRARNQRRFIASTISARRHGAPHRPFEVVRHRRLDDLERLRAEVLRGRQEGRRILRIGQRVGVDDDAPRPRSPSSSAQSLAEQRHEIRRHVRRISENGSCSPPVASLRSLAISDRRAHRTRPASCACVAVLRHELVDDAAGRRRRRPRALPA